MYGSPKVSKNRGLASRKGGGYVRSAVCDAVLTAANLGTVAGELVVDAPYVCFLPGLPAVGRVLPADTGAVGDGGVLVDV